MIQIIFPNIMCDMYADKIWVHNEQSVILAKMKQGGRQLQLPQGIFSVLVCVLTRVL